jgi:hypothetical protein
MQTPTQSMLRRPAANAADMASTMIATMYIAPSTPESPLAINRTC